MYKNASVFIGSLFSLKHLISSYVLKWEYFICYYYRLIQYKICWLFQINLACIIFSVKIFWRNVIFIFLTWSRDCGVSFCISKFNRLLIKSSTLPFMLFVCKRRTSLDICVHASRYMYIIISALWDPLEALIWPCLYCNGWSNVYFECTSRNVSESFSKNKHIPSFTKCEV